VIVAADQAYGAKLLYDRTYTGAVMGTLESWLLLRSLRTLEVRMQRQAQSAQVVAKWLSKQSSVLETQNPCTNRGFV
jgi:cystathionine gamma-synthase